eukprot:Seg44.3 transcript_id=Seg44.3/GoldUCD/mRNA.D3Y31 product="L-rhamnose-binding lectin CSL3" protein_id=Seg44.3/GoldUCD/D3Y31
MLIPAACSAKTAIVCEGSTLNLKCSSGFYIDVQYANYGRTSTTHCHGSYDSTTDCQSKDTFALVKRRCHHKQQCTYPATNFHFSDPCYGVKKYLEVRYNCTSWEDQPALQDVTLCEWGSKEISCSNGQQITILSAIYGRDNMIDCTSGFYGNTNCNSEAAMAKTQAHCNDKDKCTLHANNSFYGDPCPGVHKYLHVTYYCKIIFFLLSASTNTKCYILRLPCKQTARFSIVRANVAQQGSVLETFMFLSLQECQAKCLLNAECKSINYEVNGTQICELNDKSTEDSQNDVTLNIRTGWNYYTTSYNDPLIGDTCRGRKPCPQGILCKDSCECDGYECKRCESYQSGLHCTSVGRIIKTRVCENDYAVVRCSGQSIEIVSSFYGRASLLYCSTGNKGILYCEAEGSINAVEEECSKLSSCYVAASSSVFGDPCVGTRKYLEIRYRCV